MARSGELDTQIGGSGQPQRSWQRGVCLRLSGDVDCLVG